MMAGHGWLKRHRSLICHRIRWYPRKFLASSSRDWKGSFTVFAESPVSVLNALVTRDPLRSLEGIGGSAVVWDGHQLQAGDPLEVTDVAGTQGDVEAATHPCLKRVIDPDLEAGRSQPRVDIARMHGCEQVQGESFCTQEGHDAMLSIEEICAKAQLESRDRR